MKLSDYVWYIWFGVLVIGALILIVVGNFTDSLIWYVGGCSGFITGLICAYLTIYDDDRIKVFSVKSKDHNSPSSVD